MSRTLITSGTPCGAPQQQRQQDVFGACVRPFHMMTGEARMWSLSLSQLCARMRVRAHGLGSELACALLGSGRCS
jgi:hypothetical protein